MPLIFKQQETIETQIKTKRVTFFIFKKEKTFFSCINSLKLVYLSSIQV